MAEWSRMNGERGERGETDATEQVVRDAQGRCPGCSTALEWVGEDRGAVCVSCGWRGRLWQFDPVPLVVEAAKVALPEDATCTHHPAKRAEAVCAGTGDYICSLCAVKMDGEVYSAMYLERGGEKAAGKHFERKMDRPDSAVVLFLLLCLVPYVNFIWVLGAPVWGPWGYLKLAKANRLRREDRLADRLISSTKLVVLGVLLTVVLALLALGTLAIGVEILQEF